MSPTELMLRQRIAQLEGKLALYERGRSLSQLPSEALLMLDRPDLPDDAYRGGWLMAESNGWRIRPVLIRVEDEGEGR